MKAFSGYVWNRKFNLSSWETIWICSLNQFPPATDSPLLVVLLNYWANECWAVYKVNDAWSLFFFWMSLLLLTKLWVWRLSCWLEVWFWESDWSESFPLVLWYMVCQHLLSLIHETLGAHCPSSSRLVIMGVGSQQRAGRRKDRKRG